MNQFKRAKQIGHQTESITDLKTAGVAETKATKQNTEAIIKEAVNTSADVSSEPVDVPQSTVPTEKDIIIETPVSVPADKETKTAIAADIPVSEPPVIPDTIPVNQNVTIPPAAVYNDLPAAQPQAVQRQTSIVPPTPIVQQQYPEYNVSYSEPATVKSAKSTKKNAPNMFIQKGESKSIRKSLVLRPSSVKIAESYCAKNGGSFNELIQILLDNFIEEYGL